MWASFTDMAVKWGLPAVILIFWYLHNQQQAQLFRDSLSQQKEQAAQMNGLVKLMIEQQKQQADQHFKQTESMIEQLQFLSGQAGRIENKADTNQFCPITRGESRPK